MASSAFIAHVLDPLVEPAFAEEEKAYDKAFGRLDDIKGGRDYVRDFKRSNTYALDWSDDKILVATKDNSLRLYDLERGVEENRWEGEWMAMQTNPNQHFQCAAISWGGKFRVFDTRSSQDGSVYDVDLKKTSPHMKDFLCLCWSPDSNFIAVNNRQDQVYLLDLRQNQSLHLGASKTMQHETNGMVFAADGESLWLATGGSPGKITILPMPNLQNEGGTQMVAHQYTTVALAADPRGRHIASAGCDCLVGLWDPKQLVCTRTFGYATQTPSCLSFNYTGSLLAWGTGGAGSSGGGEKNLTIVGSDTNFYWQEPTVSPVQQVRWHPKRNCLAYALAASGLPDERESHSHSHNRSNRENARNQVVHILNLPDVRPTVAS